MPKLVGFLISPRQQRIGGLLFGCTIFTLLVIIGAVTGIGELREAMRAEAWRVLAPYEQTHAHVEAAFEKLKHEVTAPPCSTLFRQQLQRVAFLPDGLNQFYYAPLGVLKCSASTARFEKPIELGPPDYVLGEGDAVRPVWLDRELAGLGGISATIILSEPFAIALPRHSPQPLPNWLDFEIVYSGSSEERLHQEGTGGLFARTENGGGSALASIPYLREIQCVPGVCVAIEAWLPDLVAANWWAFGAALALAALMATASARCVRLYIVRHLSFEARFRRHLDAASLICAFQPIIDLRSGSTIGCEVLARWRDVDDSVVFPDRFIPIVEKHDKTLAFTRMIVKKAHEELSAQVTKRPFMVTFNIFPRDLDARCLIEVFRDFLAEPDRFEVVVELVENESIDLRKAEREIERLRQAGIKTYIDDFGTGYSSIHNLAALEVDGAKLDRSFAMAPEGSVMARMLDHAVEMVQSSGRSVVIEGIESAERLDQIRAIEPHVEFAQGYFISPPLDIAGLKAFIAGEPTAAHSPTSAADRTKAAARMPAPIPQRPSALAQPSRA